MVFQAIEDLDCWRIYDVGTRAHVDDHIHVFAAIHVRPSILLRDGLYFPLYLGSPGDNAVICRIIFVFQAGS